MKIHFFLCVNLDTELKMSKVYCSLNVPFLSNPINENEKEKIMKYKTPCTKYSIGTPSSCRTSAYQIWFIVFGHLMSPCTPPPGVAMVHAQKR